MCLTNIASLLAEYKSEEKMHNKVHFYALLLCIIFMQILTSTAIPCDSCGNECASACGTKHFRTCCFNYLRKRTDPNAMKMITNKRLIDFIMLQGRAFYTQNEMSQERRQQQRRQQQQKLLSRTLPFNREDYNGTLVFEDLQAYYD
ncbi:trissin [Stomoxys calcitrans]|uniref:Trissin n=1 Tax=Stomoxys calcitrans TaxID=35570 RepID=A0A1I8NRR9_STOCA|nr:trissin [Stomoxys calcitrans]